MTDTTARGAGPAERGHYDGGDRANEGASPPRASEQKNAVGGAGPGNNQRS